jgi:hypothetical protein
LRRREASINLWDGVWAAGRVVGGRLLLAKCSPSYLSKATG